MVIATASPKPQSPHTSNCPPSPEGDHRTLARTQPLQNSCATDCPLLGPIGSEVRGLTGPDLPLVTILHDGVLLVTWHHRAFMHLIGTALHLTQ